MFIYFGMETTQRPRIAYDKLARAAEILKTISHPVRLEILELLADNGPLAVNDIQARLETPVEQSLLSHHLIKMKDRGLLRCRREGTHQVYELTDPVFLKIFDCLAGCELL